jgi:chromosome partitioning protein
MGKIISFISGCGGTGKTTLITNIGYEYSAMGLSVVVLDLDPQHGIDATLGLNPLDYNKSFIGAINRSIKGEKTSLELTQPIDEKSGQLMSGIRVGQGHAAFAALSNDIWADPEKDHLISKLTSFIRSISDLADVVLIDLPGSVVAFPLSEAILKASDYIVMPQTPSARSLDVLTDLWQWLEMCGLSKLVIGIIPSRVREWSGHKAIMEALATFAKIHKIDIYPVVRESGYVDAAAVAGKPVAKYRSTSTARLEIQNVAKVLVEKIRGGHYEQ